MATSKKTRMKRKRAPRKDALLTKASLIDAAGRLFAAHGYENTNIREICTKAKANLAAVAHHFGGKEGLYRAVLVRAHEEMLQQDPIPNYLKGNDPEVALRLAVEHMLRVMLVRRAGHPYVGQILARELRTPTRALDELLENVMKPARFRMEEIVASLLGNADTPRLRGECTNYVIGLCLFHELGREALKRFGYPPPTRDQDVPRLADKLSCFMLGGIREIRDAHISSQIRSTPERSRKRTRPVREA